MNTLRIKRVHEHARIPQFATEGSACVDLCAVDADAFEPHPADRHAIIFRTGLAVEVPRGMVLKIYSRSGHGFNDAIRLSNCVGIVDSDYRGEIKVALRTDGDSRTKVRTGDRIAQAMLEFAPPFEIVEVDGLTPTERGEGGFGSTGTAALPETSVVETDGYVRDDESIQCALLLVGELRDVPLETIATWTLAQCIEAHGWALAVHMKASDNEDVAVPCRPAFLEAYVMTADERAASYRIV